jgi:hypothetical protein
MNRVVTLAAISTAVFLAPMPSSFADSLPWTPPPDVVQLGPCVPKMDQHWANKADLPLGPYYNIHDGKLIGIEYAVSAEDLVAGKSWLDRPLTYDGKPVAFDHFDIGFVPKGHPGYQVSHYDLHFYLVSEDEKNAITCK